MLNAKSIGKEHLSVFLTEPFVEKTVYYGTQERISEGATRSVL